MDRLIKLLNITEQQQRQVDRAALIEYLGGKDVVEMLVLHKLEGVSLTDLSRRFGQPRVTILNWIRKAQVKLRRLKLITKTPIKLPEDWHQPTAVAAGPSPAPPG